MKGSTENVEKMENIQGGKLLHVTVDDEKETQGQIVDRGAIEYLMARKKGMFWFLFFHI